MADDGRKRTSNRSAEGHWWEAEPITAERLQASTRVVDGVLRDARALREGVASERPRASALASRLVLLVDDDADARQLYAQSLEACGGFRVTMAGDGKEGLTRALQLHPDAVVSDFSMPVMDGGELARCLAEDERTRNTPVILVSAFAEEIPRDVRLSCAAFLAKPVLPDELARVVTLVIDARAPA